MVDISGRTKCELETNNCWTCLHFSVTWEPRFPYACGRMGFKSRLLPCIEVSNSSQMPCFGYKKKVDLHK